MGLLTTLLTLPVSGPVKGTLWVIERIVEQAEREMHDEAAVSRAFAEAEMGHAFGELSDDEYGQVQQELADRLRAARLGAARPDAGGPAGPDARDERPTGATHGNEEQAGRQDEQ